MNQQQPPVDRVQEFKDFLGLVHFVSRVLAVSVEIFLHRGGTFGERYLGFQGVLAGVIMFFFPILWPQSDPRPMFWLLLSYLALWVLAKVKIALRRAFGKTAEHSYYTGRPRLMWLSLRRDEVAVKSGLEPALAILTGVSTYGANEPLGAYLMAAGVGLGFAVNASIRQDRTRALDLQDALMDQQRVTDQWRRNRRR